MPKTTAQKRLYNRLYYQQHKVHRVGTRRGPKPGSRYYGPTSEEVDRERVEAFRRAESMGVRGPTTLCQTCMFCAHYAYRHDMERQFCELGRDTQNGGTCDRWEPRFKTDDEE